MYYTKKAALRLDQQRSSLQRQHKSLLVDLTKNPGRPPSVKLAESIESLRLALKQSMIENIEISRTLIKRMDVLNMGSMGDATLAQRRLSHVYSDITKTLGELDKSAAR